MSKHKFCPSRFESFTCERPLGHLGLHSCEAFKHVGPTGVGEIYSWSADYPTRERT